MSSFSFNKSLDPFHPSYILRFILLFHVLMQESSKFIIYAPFFQIIIEALLQLIVQFPVKNQQKKVSLTQFQI